ncbi:hypothetical protein ALC53_04008, partial [Atta colombica]
EITSKRFLNQSFNFSYMFDLMPKWLKPDFKSDTIDFRKVPSVQMGRYSSQIVYSPRTRSSLEFSWDLNAIENSNNSIGTETNGTVLIDVHVWYCILKEAGVIKQNQIIREEGIKYCMSILDKKDWNICHTKVVDCLDNEYRKLGSNIKENDKAYCQITCIILKGVTSITHSTSYSDVQRLDDVSKMSRYVWQTSFEDVPSLNIQMDVVDVQ